VHVQPGRQLQQRRERVREHFELRDLQSGRAGLLLHGVGDPVREQRVVHGRPVQVQRGLLGRWLHVRSGQSVRDEQRRVFAQRHVRIRRRGREHLHVQQPRLLG
jgi:hypothetical protein